MTSKLQAQSLFFAFAIAAMAHAQVVPEGTPVKIRLDEAVSSAAAQKGQMIEFTVVEDVLCDDVVVIKEGARALGTVIEVAARRRIGRAGHLDFTVDKVRATDNKLVDLRPTPSNFKGKSKGLKTGLITAGLGFVFLPAAPIGLLVKGKDVTVPRGTRFTVYTDNPYTLLLSAKSAPPQSDPGLKVQTADGSGKGIVNIESSSAGAEILVDGKYFGNAPASLILPAGTHGIVVADGQSTWEREISVTGGSTIRINALLTPKSFAGGK